MKITRTISVDADAWEKGIKHLGSGNISNYINNCLDNLSKSNTELSKEALELEISQIEANLKDLSIRGALAKQKLSDTIEQAKIKAQNDLESEQFKRWICGVCKHENYMELERCDSCHLPTRHDSKTKIKGE